MKLSFWLELYPTTNKETGAIDSVAALTLFPTKPAADKMHAGAQAMLVEMEIPPSLWDVHIAEAHVTDRIWTNPIAEHVSQLQKTEAELRGDHTGNPTF